MSSITEVNLKKEIERKMEIYEREHRVNKFISLVELRKIFSEPNLRTSLRHYVEKLRKDGEEAANRVEISILVAYVRESATKLYGVLLLIERPELIVKLHATRPPVTDKIFECKDTEGNGLYCPRKELEESEILRDVAEQVFKEQWRIPPVFRRDAHFKYGTHCFKDIQFPFPKEPRGIGHGSFGTVYKVQIAGGHLIADNYSEVSATFGLHNTQAIMNPSCSTCLFRQHS